VVVVVVAMGSGCVGGWCRKCSIWSCEKQENDQWMRWHGGGVDRWWKCDGLCEEEDDA
jgi:hypothetical protein